MQNVKNMPHPNTGQNIQQPIKSPCKLLSLHFQDNIKSKLLYLISDNTKNPSRRFIFSGHISDNNEFHKNQEQKLLCNYQAVIANKQTQIFSH